MVLGNPARERNKMKTEQAPPLRTAAGADCVRAMYELAMECDDINKRKRWLVEAAANGSQPAIDVLEGVG